jgi:hypothetical protein
MKETTIAALIAAAEALEEDGEDAFAADLRYFAGARVEPSGRDPVEVIAEMLNTAPFGDIARHCNPFLQGIMQNEALLERLRAAQTVLPPSHRDCRDNWHSWVPFTLGLSDPPNPLKHREVWLWRNGWEAPRRADPIKLPPEMNAAGLFWRPVDPQSVDLPQVASPYA